MGLIYRDLKSSSSFVYADIIFTSGSATAGGATLSATSTIAAGAASGSSGATAAGATLAATSSIIAGSALAAASTPGATLTSSAQMVGGGATNDNLIPNAHQMHIGRARIRLYTGN